MNIVNRRPPGADCTPARPCPLLADLEEGSCRFPVSGEGTQTRYCGRPALARKSWCARCDRRVHSGVRAADLEEIADVIKRGGRR